MKYQNSIQINFFINNATFLIVESMTEMCQ